MLRTILPILNRGTYSAVRTYKRDGNRKPRDQAGVRIQSAVLDNVKDLEEDPEKDFEADFNRLNVSHRKHEEELTLRKEQHKYFIVRSKYFKTEKQPNFLTWAEKEQIRNLNKNDPEEWTPEQLSESFPAVEDVIIKILKAKWTPSSMKIIQKHDESVKKNWDLFKTDQLKDLDPEVRKHLKKFSSRSFDSIQNAYIQSNNDQIEFKFPKPKEKEFLHIVSSCKKNKAKEVQETNNHIEQKKINNKIPHLSSKDGLSASKFSKNQNITYDELFEKTEKDSTAEDKEEMHLSVSLLKESTPINAAVDVKSDISNQSVADTSKDFKVNVSKDNKIIDLTSDTVGPKIAKYATKDVFLSKLTKQYPVQTINLKITIPYSIRKRGTIYKVNDCFYDYRGDFLYRVPILGN